jgi:hypothetical protein
MLIIYYCTATPSIDSTPRVDLLQHTLSLDATLSEGRDPLYCQSID